eukprot:3940763-Rhodomonas_salina.2
MRPLQDVCAGGSGGVREIDHVRAFGYKGGRQPREVRTFASVLCTRPYNQYRVPGHTISTVYQAIQSVPCTRPYNQYGVPGHTISTVYQAIQS